MHFHKKTVPRKLQKIIQCFEELDLRFDVCVKSLIIAMQYNDIRAVLAQNLKGMKVLSEYERHDTLAPTWRQVSELPLDSSLKIVECELYHLVFHQKLDFENGEM